MNAGEKQNVLHRKSIEAHELNVRLAAVANDKQIFSPRTHTTVYDEETNTHWEVAEGQTVEDIRELIKSFKSAE